MRQSQQRKNINLMKNDENQMKAAAAAAEEA